MTTPEELDRLILDIPSVTTLFEPDPDWHGLPGLAQVFPGTPPQTPATLSSHGDAIEVHVRIGVNDSLPAPETARRVAAAIRHALTPGDATAQDTVTVNVQISLITTGDAPVHRKDTSPG